MFRQCTLATLLHAFKDSFGAWTFRSSSLLFTAMACRSFWTEAIITGSPRLESVIAHEAIEDASAGQTTAQNRHDVWASRQTRATGHRPQRPQGHGRTGAEQTQAAAPGKKHDWAAFGAATTRRRIRQEGTRVPIQRRKGAGGCTHQKTHPPGTPQQDPNAATEHGPGGRP